VRISRGRPASGRARGPAAWTRRTLVLVLLLGCALGLASASPTSAEEGTSPNFVIEPASADLQVCPDGAACKDEVQVRVELDGAVKSPEPKCAGFPNFQDPATCPRQTIGAFSIELRFDAKLLELSARAGSLMTRPEVTCMTLSGAGRLNFGCVTKGKPKDSPSGPGTLALIDVRPTDGLRAFLAEGNKPVQTQILGKNCHLADLQGHAITVGDCGDAAVTAQAAPDGDHDGCSDQEEKGADPMLGGKRDLSNFWDFFDTPTGVARTRDKSVAVGDIVAVVSRFGSSGSARGDPLSAPPPPPAYHTGYDRTDDPASLDGWRLRGPDGVIAILDVVVLVQQFGHTCQAPP